MQNLKFRVWNKSTQKLSPPFGFGDLTGYEGEGGAHVLMKDETLVSNEILNENLVFQQFTSLKDSAGREIFEGDVLKSAIAKSNSKLTETVIFEDGCFCIFPNYENTFHQSNLTMNKKLIENFQYEIIGNIFENPELLQKNP